MEFVALLSGGKDSVYNIVKCVEEGHVLRCLANLSPFPSSIYYPNTIQDTTSIPALGYEELMNEELHSFMYQSAGASVMPAYADCLQVPLFVEHIQGSAKHQGLDYETNPTTTAARNDTDEVEDLYHLLLRVKEMFPNVKAVSCGAIVSTYQRLRVENVCERLGMTLLAYLWQRDRNQLLPEMLDAGIDAVLVKVAGVGLVPEKHLQKTLKSLYPQLLQLHRKYGLDLCGEGGEYESLVLNAPCFHRRIVIEESQVLLDEEDCQVGNLKVLRYQLLPNEQYQPIAKHSTLTAVLEADMATLLEDGGEVLHEEEVAASTEVLPSFGEAASSSSRTDKLSLHKDGYGSTPLLLPHLKETFVSNPSKEDIQAQVRDVMVQLQNILAEVEVALADTVFVHLYISNMDWFAIVNEEYCQWFGKHPPSRSCVMMQLGNGIGVALSAFFLQGSYQSMLPNKSNTRPELREVLHVKSMSHWAPLCIGPYAQCNTIYHHVLNHVAGQIPLNPGSMALREHNNSNPDEHEVKLDLLLALRHAARVLNVQQSSLSHVTQVLVYVNMSHPLHHSNSTVHWKGYKRLVQHALNKDYQLQVEGEPQSSGNNQNDLFAEDLLAAEQDNWSDEDDETTAEKAKDQALINNSIIQIVGVPGLPRNSSVEVEIVSIRTEVLLPVTRWQHLHLSTRSIPADNSVQIVHAAEIWPTATRQVNLQTLFPSLDNCLYCEANVKVFPGCVGSAVLNVCTSSPTPLGGKYHAADIAKVLARGMSLVYSQSNLTLTTSMIRKMTLFYSVPHLNAGCEELLQALTSEFSLLGFDLTSSACPLILLSAVALEKNMIASMSIASIDFHQIESEAWIQRGKGFTS